VISVPYETTDLFGYGSYLVNPVNPVQNFVKKASFHGFVIRRPKLASQGFRFTRKIGLAIHVQGISRSVLIQTWPCMNQTLVFPASQCAPCLRGDTRALDRIGVVASILKLIHLNPCFISG